MTTYLSSQRPKLLTVQEVANELSLRTETVLAYIKAGKIPAVKIGRTYRIRPEKLDAFINSSSNA